MSQEATVFSQILQFVQRFSHLAFWALPSADAALPSADAALPSADAALPSADAALPSADAALSSADAALSSADAALSSAVAALSSAVAALSSAEHLSALTATRENAPSHCVSTYDQRTRPLELSKQLMLFNI